MPRSTALRLVFALLFLAALACSPIPSLPNAEGLANTAVAAVGGTQGASIQETLAAAVSAGLGPTPAFTPGPTPDWPADSYLPAELERGALKLDNLAAAGDGSNFYGPIMLLQVTNPGTQDVLTTIPCGLIFQPNDTELQRLMVVQAYSATVAAGGQADLKPYVVCIDASKHAPSENAAYTLGTIASGDLLKLANCICTQPLTNGSNLGQELGLQFAIWHTSDPEFPGNAGSSPFAVPIQAFLDVGTDIANGWLKSRRGDHPLSTPDRLPDKPPTNLRGYRRRTDRNLLLGFFALLFLVGGGLIWWLYGGSAAAIGIVCIAGGAGLAGAVLLITLGFQWLSDWLDRRELNE